MNYLAVITENSGYEACYVSFKDRVAQDGALVGIPAVTSSSTHFTINTPALNSTTTSIDGISHAASTLLVFNVTAGADSAGEIGILSVAYETPTSDGTEIFHVKRTRP